MPGPPAPDVTQLLTAWRAGDPAALKVGDVTVGHYGAYGWFADFLCAFDDC